jgi:DNA-binding GntR family transcriptional regulator
VTHSLEDCYPQLHDAIIRGVLLPGERLVELELADRFNVGRAAVRTALARLEQDGLIEREPHKGARVRVITFAEALEILEARSVLEGLAARLATQHASEADITELQRLHGEMQAQVQQGDLLGMSESNTIFHDTILKAANSSTLLRLLQSLHPHHVHQPYRMILLPGRASQSVDEHQAIVEAIAARQPDNAEAAMRYHLEQTAAALRRQQSVTS